ncbi:unnamed protein product [Urochloa decumbens]|uniref:NAD-dependent epimerase/dehydratase domain-containing protein n=1 Tax=Urochloa decumbens TaxID=240449 RepID=A0ABC9D182_9POAL
MSAGDKMKTACVTGGSGYIASALIKMLLEKGYAVKTAVRNPALGPLTVLRADLEEEGSFDDAVAGCDYAFLVAAPVNLASGEDPEKELIEPAVRGTLNVMRSCVKAGTVKRVILFGAAPSMNINTSVPNCLALLSGDEVWLGVLKVIERTSGSVPLGHIDDLCRAELFVAEEPAAAGRYNSCGLSTTVVELARFLEHKYPEYDVKRNLQADDQLLEKPRVCLSSAKLVREGFEFKHNTLGEIYDNVVEYGKALGILPN